MNVYFSTSVIALTKDVNIRGSWVRGTWKHCSIFAIFFEVWNTFKMNTEKKLFTNSPYQVDDFYLHFINIPSNMCNTELIWVMLIF